ncbi:MAG: isocitrate/isopropylmalate dehydrogenase family protein [Coriobacteriia bacterium]|nr:isocitrate/isopropylmalate dehydrogenase family protein [Coriobacteriia bacterium]
MATTGITHTVTLIPGDGIGPEITRAMQTVIAASGADINWEIQQAGEVSFETSGELLPQAVLDSIRSNKVALKGPLTTPVGHGFRSLNVTLRKELDLFSCIRPSQSFRGTGARYEDVDIVLFRENTEDLYAGIEFEQGSEGVRRIAEVVADLGAGDIRDDAGLSLKPISVFGTRRIMKAAMDYAVANGRKKVTIIHKANIMKHTDGLFLRVCREVAAEYAQSAPEIEVDDWIVDAACTRLVTNPELFDVLVCPNLFGDIVSDLCAGLVGGLGIAPGANIGDDFALFEPVHGSAPSYAGQNLANPTAIMLSAVMMLRHLGEQNAAERVHKAIAEVIAEGKVLTYDLMRMRYGTTDGASSTQEYAEAIAERIA